jgi:hypothetical protein
MGFRAIGGYRLGEIPQQSKDDRGNSWHVDSSETMKDKGCHLHPRCLTCPRPVCVYDEPQQQQKVNR